ncbi:MAG: hypothetical protein RLY27_102 [Pseudomonadota bacterium]|jgi:uncharacterized membrane protein
MQSATNSYILTARREAGMMSSSEADLTHLAEEEIDRQRAWQLLARIFVIAGGIGWFASAALLIERIQSLQDPTENPSCDISPFVSCGALFDRWQASLFGFPNAILGVAGFVVPIVIGLGIMAGANFKNWFWRGAVVGLGAAWIFVTWLFTQSIYNIGVLCPYCLVVWVATIPMWWTVLIITITQGYWGAKIRNLVSNWGISFLPAIIILNYGVIAFLIIQELGSRIASSF